MELKDIAHISGKSGLHRILKPTRSGVIVESLDEKKAKQVVGTQNRVSVLKEISIYTTDKDGSVPLETVLEKIFDKYNNSIPVNPESSTSDQSKFLESVLPTYDKSRVYNSDIKRLVTWYGLLIKNAPELFEKKAVEEVKEETPVATEVESPAKETEAAVGKEEEGKLKTEKKKPAATKKEAPKTNEALATQEEEVKENPLPKQKNNPP